MTSLLTALTIQGNETDVGTYQDRSSNKWGFEVSRMERGNYRPLITSAAVFDSRSIAKTTGDEYVQSIRALDLTPQRKDLSDTLGDAAPIVQAISDASQ